MSDEQIKALDSADMALDSVFAAINASFDDDSDSEWIRSAVKELHRIHRSIAKSQVEAAVNALAAQETVARTADGDPDLGLTIIAEISGRRTGEVVIERVNTTSSGLETYSASVVLDGEQSRSIPPFMHETMNGPLECIRKAVELLDESPEPRTPRTN